MEQPEDILYLKQFVKQHPTNKMGWYLLGKHYLQAGKEGKANYCFIQAGDIYEAFEQESHPLGEAQLEQLKEWDKQQKKMKLIRKTMFIALPLLLLALIIPINDLIRKGTPSKPSPNTSAQSPDVGVVIVSQQQLRPVGYSMNAIIAAGDKAPTLSMAIRLEENKGWKQWVGSVRYLMSVDRGTNDHKFEVSMYDRDSCVCEPGDTRAINKRFTEWKEEQEMHWTLASGIHHYNERNGKWPEKLDDLIRPYPNNILSGEGEGMKDSFSDVLTKIMMETKNSNDSATEQINQDNKKQEHNSSDIVKNDKSIGTNGLFQEKWNKPLEIVIDTSKHRLAVVQNDVIIRSYKVGLGGEQTPEGNFYISEKVRNPNGTDNGIFGSRGMALSNTLYAIHGTGDLDSIEKDESLGCIRMRKADVEELYDLVPLGTVVKIKNGTLPPDAKAPAERFQLAPKQNETNPAKVYQWLN
ncbi:L,D-transpeptidase [Paenibacillus sp. GSMTC-2017]|uniref:L,D-transpeptidase family protein n=1 Tax=Paenibacillus sp. GSMTC-2017 TaxID=2794350 RepID=UPI0018D8DBA4|nr:L,D-transpeptidase [Paenibacillus sp. GSMTC-2017]MBH5318189.1 L,D-transpeptidase [Paenibacillus sp. GSMTC-2017]